MLDTLLGWLGAPALFLAGLLLRALLAIMVLAVIVLPIAAALMVWNWVMKAVDRAAGLQQVGHVQWRRDVYYTPGHLWLQRRAQALRIGLDDLAQRVLPEIKDVSLPAAGTAVNRGDALGTIRCLDGTVTLRAPVAGMIAAVNERLFRKPALLHRDPYRRAWLVDVEPTNADYQVLPSNDKARAWIASEDRRLTEFFEHQLGLAAADGGELMVPQHRLLSPEQWDAVRKGFLEV